MSRSHALPTALVAALVVALSACGHRAADTAAVPTEPVPPAVDTALEGAAADAGLAATSSLAPPATDSTSAHFARLDGDGNGRVSAEEHLQGAAAMFRAMDGDGDGMVTAAEMDAAGGDPRMTSIEKIATIDTDKDGQLAASEHASGSRTMFATMDIDADGYLSAEEVQAGHDRLLAGAPGV